MIELLFDIYKYLIAKRNLCIILKAGYTKLTEVKNEFSKCVFKRNNKGGQSHNIIECGKLLQTNGYKIKILNTINFKKSMKYYPFAYIRSEKDILKLVTTLIANTKGESKSSDDFWVKAETLLYTAIIGYIYYEAPVEEQNFNTLIEFINASEVREDDETFKNQVDLLFEELERAWK